MNISVKKPDGVAAEHDPRPIVAMPRRGVPGGLIATFGIIAALLLFVILETQRRQAQFPSPADDQSAMVYVPPPPLSVPPEPITEPQYVPVVAARTSAPPRPPPSRSAMVPAPARQQPVMPMPPFVLNESLPPPGPMPVQPQSRPATSAAPALVIDTSGDVPIGTLIPAVLETPIDTSRPGHARAIVARDVRALDGYRVLVPRGSRLTGEYQSDVRAGQNRVLVNWTRLIRPDGAAIRLGAPSADAMGGAGIPGKYHSYFLKRFLNATLQTALSVGGNLVGSKANATVIVGLPNSLNAAAGQGGQGLFSSDVRPKVTVKSGTLFNVFVAREVDFSAASQAP